MPLVAFLNTKSVYTRNKHEVDIRFIDRLLRNSDSEKVPLVAFLDMTSENIRERNAKTTYTSMEAEHWCFKTDSFRLWIG